MKRMIVFAIILIFALFFGGMGVKYYQNIQVKKHLAQEKLEQKRVEEEIKKVIHTESTDGISFEQRILTQPAKIGIVLPILENKQVTTQLEQIIEKTLKIFKEKTKDKKDTFYVLMKGCRFNEEIVSFYYNIQTNLQGKKETTFHTQTFQLKTGQLLKWTDLLEREEYVEKLKEFLLKKGIKGVESIHDWEQIPFILNAESVTFYLANSQGFEEINVPLKEISEILKSEYVSAKVKEEAMHTENKIVLLNNGKTPLLPNVAKGKLVALTFDDGPNPSTTRELLTFLKKENVLATFFVLGNRAAQYPEVVKEVFNEGHQIASHTMNHKNLVKLSPEEAREEVNQASDTIESIIKWKPDAIRPPYGATNATLNATYNAAVIMWDVDSLDWKTKNAQSIYEKALEGVHDGAIILFHDIYATTVEAIPQIIQELKRQNYTFVTVDQLILARTSLENGREYFSVKP